MKIELTMTELLLIIDMIKNGTEQDNEGDDFYLMQDFLDGNLHHKCTKCNATMDKTTNQENLQDSTNGYTYYPQENKTVFNTKGK